MALACQISLSLSWYRWGLIIAKNLNSVPTQKKATIVNKLL